MANVHVNASDPGQTNRQVRVIGASLSARLTFTQAKILPRLARDLLAFAGQA